VTRSPRIAHSSCMVELLQLCLPSVKLSSLLAQSSSMCTIVYHCFCRRSKKRKRVCSGFCFHVIVQSSTVTRRGLRCQKLGIHRFNRSTNMRNCIVKRCHQAWFALPEIGNSSLRQKHYRILLVRKKTIECTLAYCTVVGVPLKNH